MRRMLWLSIAIGAFLTLGSLCDQDPPRITVLHPQHRDTVYFGSVEIAARVTDDIGVEMVEFRPPGHIQMGQLCLPDTYWTTWNTAGLQTGSGYWIGIFASDVNGKQASESILVYLAAKK